METNRRAFLRAAGSSAFVGASALLGRPAQAQGPAAPPVSFPGVPNPLEGDVEVIGTGYMWSEGPVWIGDASGYLLFTDVPGNAIYRWDGKRVTAFLAPSGYTGFPIPDTIR